MVGRSLNTLYKKFRAAASSRRDLFIVDLIYHSGCNAFELSQLKEKDYLPSKNSLSINGRLVKLDFFSELLPEGIFSKGKFVSQRRIEQIFSECSSRSKVKFTPLKLSRCKFAGKDCLKNYSSLQRIYDNGNGPLLVSLIYETGCKISQLISVKISDIGENCIYVDGKKRKISSSLSKRLKEKYNCSSSSFLFSSSSGRPLSGRRIQQLISSSSIAGENLTAEKIRKAAIIRMNLGGKPLEEIREELGLSRLDFGTHKIIDMSGGQLQ